MRSVSRTSNTRQSHIPKKTIPRTSKLAKKPPQSKLAEGRAKQTQGKQQSGLLKLGPPGTGKCKGDTSARKSFSKVSGPVAEVGNRSRSRRQAGVLASGESPWRAVGHRVRVLLLAGESTYPLALDEILPSGHKVGGFDLAQSMFENT